MNKYKIITLACIGVALCAILSLTGWFSFRVFTGGGFFGMINDSTGEYEPRGEIAIPAEGIKSLEIDWVSGGATFFIHSGDDVIITEYARRTLKSDEEMIVRNSGDTIKVEFMSKKLFFQQFSKKLEVRIPEKLSKEFSSIGVTTVSGAITLADVNADSLTLDSVSGSVSLKNTKARTLNAETVSGGISFDTIQTETLKLDSTSGRVVLSGVTADLVTAETVSGAQDLYGSFASMALSSVSGRITVDSDILPEKITAETVSGAIDIVIPETDDTLSVNHSAVSGKFSSDLPVVMQDSNPRFSFEQVSGSTNITTRPQ